MREHTDDKNKEKEDYMLREYELQDSFEKKARTVYKLIIAYIEASALKEYLSDFKAEFGALFTDNTLFDGKFDDGSGELYSNVVSRFWDFLSPFEFSQQSYMDKLLKQTGISYLERILRNTQFIINEINAQPTTEPQVYNVVKFVIKSVFRNSLQPTAGFFKSFKKYTPDILIPEIHAAVEYKYADTVEKLKSQIEEVLVDTKGYTGDINYKIFFAVFYVTDDFWGIDRFDAAWDEMDFPKNWKGIYVVGKKY